jgi:hypothetical protein
MPSRNTEQPHGRIFYHEREGKLFICNAGTYQTTRRDAIQNHNLTETAPFLSFQRGALQACLNDMVYRSNLLRLSHVKLSKYRRYSQHNNSVVNISYIPVCVLSQSKLK